MKPALLFCTLLCSLTAFSAEKNASPVRLEKVQLVGDLTDGKASFLLTGIAHVSSASSASLPILSGTVAVTEFGSHNKWNIRENGGQYIAVFDRKGDFHFQLKFQATVRAIGDKKEVRFQVAPGPLQSIRIRGLSSETQLEFEGAARPERHGDEFTSILGEDGRVRFSWKDAQPQTAGKLFYAAEMLSQISVSPGLLRQAAALNFKVMQGELRSLTILLRGPGEVTRVQGDEVLAWDIEPVSNSNDRRLTIKFNQPQTNQFSLQIQAQATLGAFPQTADVLAFQPESATRFSGFFRVVNDGAVRLEVTRATGLSQVSPETFPETEVTRALLHPTGTQRFVYRFSGPDFALRVQADQILPELTVSEVVSYHFAENELAIDSELELEVREAPLRELSINVPPGYAVARLAAPGLGDYFIGERAGKPELRLIFVQLVTGHQVVQLRLERAQSAIEETWSLPPLEVPQAKSVRGYIASAADPGFRLSPQRTSGLTEIAGAFFPKKQPGIQSAFRLSDSSWQAVVHVDRMPQTVQADAFHLFSIGEGIAYGSSVINYTIRSEEHT